MCSVASFGIARGFQNHLSTWGSEGRFATREEHPAGTAPDTLLIPTSAADGRAVLRSRDGFAVKPVPVLQKWLLSEASY